MGQKFLKKCKNVDLSFLEDKKYCKMITQLKEDLNKSRFQHTLGVVQAAVVLAERYDVDIEKAILASLLHDCAKKNESKYELILSDKACITKKDMKPSPSYHAFLGSKVAQCIYDINDKDVLNAICFHTTGRFGMSDLEKVVYLADLIEPNRDHLDLEYLRDESMKSLDRGVYAAMNHNLIYLFQNDRLVDKESLLARNELLERGFVE